MAAMPPAATPVRDVDEAMSASGGIGLKETAPLRYVVKKGDTLWGIANRYLADAYQWPELWYVNGKIANPHKIYPGDVLQLMVVNGRTQLVRGDDLERLSPRIRESELEDALPAIPIDAIRNFLRGPRVVDADTLNKAPYILSFVDEHIIGAMNNPVFIKNLKRDDGAAFSVVHKGVVYKDPDTGEILGYEAIPSGEAEIRAFGTPSDAMLTKSFREILLGDRLLPLEAENFQAFFYPHAPKAAVGAKIISVFNGVSQISQFQIVTLNRGSSQGLEAGHVLTILQAPRKIVDPVTGRADTLPEQEAGLLMVFKVMPKVSYGLVMSATRPVHVLDHAEKPDLKHSH
jgi:LysM repeat protein